MEIIIFIIFLLICLPFNKSVGFYKSKYKKINTLAIVLLIIGAMINIGVAVIGSNSISKREALNNETIVKSKDGFNIDKYQVVLNVSEDNKVNVTEIIDTDFYESGHHGIYRFIPEWSIYTASDNKSISRRANITNLASSEQYAIDTVKGKKRIKIGSQYTILGIGSHKYEITYTADFGKDPYEGFDEFIFHCFGDYWSASIYNPIVKVVFPKSISVNDVKLFADKYRKKDITNDFTIQVKDNALYLKAKSSKYYLDSALTIDVKLPEGYFNSKSDNLFGFSFIICLLCILATIVVIILWFIIGRDKKDIETVELYPPEDLDSAQLGYIYNGLTGSKLIASLVVELAAKGYINIVKNGHKDFILNTNEITPNLKPLTKNEKALYDELFTRYGFTTTSFPTKSFNEVIDIINKNLIDDLDDKVFNTLSYKVMLFYSILFVVLSVLFGIAYCSVKDMSMSYELLYKAAFISNGITFLFTILLKSNTQYSATLKAKIKGFKNYLESAEKEQVEAQAESNPNLFYDILPYAYVLGITKVWIDKFNVIPTPEYNLGTFNYTDINDYDDLSDNIVDHTSTSTSTSSGGGCSSCGGGCSSCGGGCSSCGGGGSW